MLRHVKRLRLACTRAEHARHGRILFEDALRTASFDDEDRLILVRRLDLGRLPLRASATQWSRRLEQSYRRSRPIPVYAEHPGAAQADAVFFATRYEPWLLLAQRMIAGQPAREWFWRPALPGWQPAQPAEQTLRLCFRTLAALGGLRLTLWLAIRLPTLAPLLRSLEPEDLAPLRAELGEPATLRADCATVKNDRAAPPLFAGDARLIRTWGIHDPRTRWLAAAMLARNADAPRATLASILVSPTAVERLVRHWVDSTPLLSSPPAPLRPHETRPAPPERSAPPPVETPAPKRVLTAAGGLFFTVPLLARAGLPAVLRELPPDEAAALPWQILQLVFRHARISEDDLAAEIDPGRPAAPLPTRWLLALNRQSLRLATVNLRRLVVRPALVSLSPTHVDLFFRASEADIRIRRVGLDLDPGWVPWLGRVIHYHFNRED